MKPNIHHHTSPALLVNVYCEWPSEHKQNNCRLLLKWFLLTGSLDDWQYIGNKPS